MKRVTSKRREKHAMLSITKRLAVLGVVLALPLAAARAEQPASPGPVQLSDNELEQVSAGDGNVPINAGIAVQANALGSAAQTATVQALQSVTQLQTFPGFPQ
jgi:hypothetical protein